MLEGYSRVVLGTGRDGVGRLGSGKDCVGVIGTGTEGSVGRFESGKCLSSKSALSAISLLCGGIVELPTLIALGVPNEHTFLHMRA